MRGIRAVAALGALAVLAPACSGGDDASPATTSSSSALAPTSAAPTTVLPTTPPTVLPTLPPTTTAPAPTTTAPPPTTAPPTVAPGSIEEQVTAAMLESLRLFQEALADPTNDDKGRAAVAAYADPNQLTVLNILADYRENNWRSTPNPAVPASDTPYPGEVVVDVAAGTASVTYCYVNSNVVVETGGNPDGTDRVVDDSVSSSRVRVDLVLVDGRWLNSDGEQITEWKGASTCPDLS